MTAFTTIRAVGSALPADVLAATISDANLQGLTADDYHLELGVTPREAANRAWSVLTSAWHGYREALSKLAEGDRAVGLTREKWLAVLLRELGFGRVPTTPAGGLIADDKSFPISHAHELAVGKVPLHLLGWGVPLDMRTPGQPGAADRAPHAMVQEYLNRTDDALWAMISNGRTLRLLRDSSTLIGQSYVEFDLESMFDGEVFSDFVVLFLVCHASRFEPDQRDDSTIADCWLERWRTYAAETGTRALQALSPGVKQAIEALGTGFLRHPANDLHHRLVDGRVSEKDVREALLRLVYRLLFCFVAEDRGLLLDPNGTPTAKQRYERWFSTARLRRISTRRRGSAHPDLWQALSLVLDGLGQEGGRPELALPGLGGLFDTGEIDVIVGCQLANEPLLTAVRHLTVVQPVGGGPRRVIDYRNLGAEELGSIYESLLEFVPRYDHTTRTFTLESIVGNDRKTSGAYYTPTSLIDCLLDSALDPLLDEAERAADPEAALLALTVCDPACGSGHFLVAAARRIAARLAAVRARGNGGGTREPTIIDEQRAMHDVVDRCIYGVDLNPMAAELAKVSLWLESVQPGRALSFLNAHIKVGNALLGTTPALLVPGLPDEAFTALDGDDKKLVASLRKRNRQEREGQGNLFGQAGISVANANLARTAREMDALPNVTLADVHLAQRRFFEFDNSPALKQARAVADAWCSAFVAVKAPGKPEITHATIERLTDGGTPGGATAASLAELSAQYRFFHWHLEFPQIFTVADTVSGGSGPGWTGGFSCVLGNPPWERIKLQEQEFFAALDPEIAAAPNAAARKRLIVALVERNPALHNAYETAKRRADGESQLMRLSGRFPLCGRGDINTYAVFAEHDRAIVADRGRLGVILPTGIATDATTQHFFKDVVVRRALVALYSFENEGLIFSGVHHAFKFCLLLLSGHGLVTPRAQFAFYLRHPHELRREGAHFELSPDELLLLNPNTGTCPLFRARRDAEIALAIYRRWPVLIRRGATDNSRTGNPWGLSFMSMFHMANDSGLFRTRDQLGADGWTLSGNVFERHAEDGSTDLMRPLYVGLMVTFFDHRAADVVRSETVTQRQNQPSYISDEEKCDPKRVARPAYWVSADEVQARLHGRWSRPWLLGIGDVTSATNWRTAVCSAFPLAGAGHSLPLLFPLERPELLVTALSSLVFDFVSRQKVGGNHLTFFILEQLPVPPPAAFDEACPWDASVTYAEWIGPRVLELTYTAHDMAPFARDLGDTGSPFRWDVKRRADLRAELDACFFHLYGLDRDDTEYVLGTFPIASRREPGLAGRILRAYDALAASTAYGETYTSPLTPSPGFGPRHPQT